MARLPSRETISSISHKFGIRYGHAREQTSCGSSSTRWSRVVNGGLKSHHLHLKAIHFLFPFKHEGINQKQTLGLQTS